MITIGNGIDDNSNKLIYYFDKEEVHVYSWFNTITNLQFTNKLFEG